MMRSMMSAVTGLKAQQTAMDVIGNNIANVNTAGFKSSSTQFEDLFYQTLSGGSEETNPSQVGYGAQVSGVTKNMSSAGATTTDDPWNLYIDGDGYFAVAAQSTATTPAYFTRVGNFTFDTKGYLVDANGNYVMGTSGTPGNITLKAICLDGATFTPTDPADTVDKGVITVDPTSTTGIQYGDLRDITFNKDGSISATYNSVTGTITDGTDNYKVVLAAFVNEKGLSQVGSNYYQPTQSSGVAGYTIAGDGNTTKLESNALEMSNVDVATEFTNMIVTQRGFQANARVITTSDTMLEELVNLKRS